MSKSKLCDHFTLKEGSPNKAKCDLCRKEMIWNSDCSDKKMWQKNCDKKVVQEKFTNKYGEKIYIKKFKNLVMAILFFSQKLKSLIFYKTQNLNSNKTKLLNKLNFWQNSTSEKIWEVFSGKKDLRPW